MTVVAVIPARYASTRFPGKALAADTGKTLIQHVCERVGECARIDRTIVATDDKRIVEAVRSFGGQAVMTRADHPTGTDRVAEVAAGLDLAADDLVLNVQGDEPEIEPAALSRLIAAMDDAPDGCRIGTLAAPFDDAGPGEGPGSPLDPNAVKVVVDGGGRALYFSRSLVPYPRVTAGRVDRPSRWLLHLGVYAFRAETLQSITGDWLPRCELEETEGLEQLRWLAHGLTVGVTVVEHRFVGIDTKEAYAAFVRRVADTSRKAEAGIGSK